VLVLTLGSLLTASPAFAGWSFTASLYQADCPAGTPMLDIPTLGPFPTKEMCESSLALVKSATQGFSYTVNSSSHYCEIGYRTTPCTGFDDTFGSSSSTSVHGYETQVSNLQGSEAAKPFFTPHYSSSFERYSDEARPRARVYRSLNTGIMPASSVRYQRHFLNRVQGWTPEVAAPPPGYASGTTADPNAPLPAIGSEGGGTPVGGVGITQGAPDKPPPPTPEAPRDGRFCRKRWYFNTTTQTCYGSEESCRANGKLDPSTQCVLTPQ
jgi:hypothetical protein